MQRKNKSKKIMVVFGTRPEAIKMAPVIRELYKYPRNFQVKICVTSQHREMLNEMLNLFKIQPHYDLDIMKENQTLFEVTTECLSKIEKVLRIEKPDIVLVQGDTTTTFTTALAAFYLKIPLGHIEAGLRTEDKYMPFPEEINRRLVSHIADFHFVPTEQAKQNLIKEGISKQSIFLTGNTIIDAFSYILKEIKNKKILVKDFSFLNLNSNRLILVTAHRRENFGKPIRNICHALKKIVKRNKNLVIVYPVHPNPNIDKPVREILDKVKGIYLLEPLDYASFVYLMSLSYLILTDSGGIQEEAPSLRKPVLILRQKTERPELLKYQMGQLVGTDTDNIVESVERLLNNRKIYKSFIKENNPFGDGRASSRIVRILSKLL